MAMGRVMWLAGMAALASAAPRPHVTHVYVDSSAPGDVADGSLGRPFASVHAAQRALRAGVGRGTQRVVHVAGKHHLTEPLVLTKADSGEPGAPVRWVGQGPAATSLSGGKTVPASAFSPAPGRAGVVTASLSSLGFNATTLGKMACPHPAAVAQVYLNGQPQTMARTPNIAANGTWMWYGYENLGKVTDTSFVLSDDAAVAAMKPALTGGSEGLWLHGYWKFDWRETFIKIESIAQAAGGGWTLTRDSATVPQYPFTDGCRFYAVGAISFLDQPGEYHIDRTDGTLYFMPPRPLGDGDEVVVSFLETVVQNSGASHILFEDMTISDARGSVMSLTSAANVTVAGNTVSNSGGSCLGASGTGLVIENNTVFGCGTSGVSVSSGDVQTLAHGGTRVVGNNIHDFAQIVRTYSPGVAFTGVGLYVANNTVSQCPHTAMTGGGNDHLFEFNTIRNACFECTDVGSFYTGRSWSQRGNVARYNTFDTIFATERLAQKSESQSAFYLDDQMSGWSFYGNTIRNAALGVLLGGGRRNTISGNHFENNKQDVHFDDRGLTWQLNYCRYNCTAPPGPHGGYQPACFRFELEKLNYTQPPYAAEYPELAHIYDDYPCVPVYNRIENNTYCHSKVAGNFIDATPAQIATWHSTFAGNKEQC